MITALIARMGQAYVFSKGQSSYLHDGMISKLDTSDYSKAVTTDEAGNYRVPIAFARDTLSLTLTADADGYVSLEAVAAAAGMTLEKATDKSLVLLLPAGVASFALEVSG